MTKVPYYYYLYFMKYIFSLFISLLPFCSVAQPALNWVQQVDGTTTGSSVWETWAIYMSPGATVLADSRGHVVVAGTQMGVSTNLQVNGAPYIIPINYSNDCFLASYKNDGSIDWGFNLGSSSFDAPMGISLDSADNIYLWGYFESTLVLDPGVGAVSVTPADGNRDIFIVKYNKDGVYQNHMQLVYAASGVQGEYIYDIEINNNGDLLVAGNYLVNIDLDPGAAVYNLPGAGAGTGQKIFVSRYDSSFQFLEAAVVRTIDNTRSMSLLDFEIASDGGYFMGGEFVDSVDFDGGTGEWKEYSPGPCGFVARYNAAHELVWANRIRGDWHSKIHRIAVTDDDKVIVAGQFVANTTYFNMAAGDSTVFSDFTGGYWDWDLFIAEYDVNGLTTWARHLPQDEYHTIFNTLSYDPYGDRLFAAFSFTGQVDLDYGNSGFTLSGPLFPTYTMGLAIYNESNGSFQFASKITSSGINYNFVDVRDGHLYMLGTYRNTIDVDLGAGVSNISTTNSPGMFISEYCMIPEVSYADSTGMTCVEMDSVQLDPGYPVGGVYSGDGVYGNMFSPSDAGIGTHTIVYTYTDVNGCSNSQSSSILVTVCTEVNENAAEGFILYPNPAENNITVQAAAGSSTDFVIYNYTGAIIHKGLIAGKTVVDIRDFAKGLYFIRTGNSVRSFVKN
jgi:hypothetical protein